MTGLLESKKKRKYTRMHLGIYIVIPLNLLACLMPRPQSRLQLNRCRWIQVITVFYYITCTICYVVPRLSLPSNVAVLCKVWSLYHIVFNVTNICITFCCVLQTMKGFVTVPSGPAFSCSLHAFLRALSSDSISLNTNAWNTATLTYMHILIYD